MSPPESQIDMQLDGIHRSTTAMHCPFFMRKSMMGLCAQLEDFDEQLYKVSGKTDDPDGR